MFLRDLSTVNVSLCVVREVLGSDTNRSPGECGAEKSYDGCREHHGSFVVTVEGKRGSDELLGNLQRI